MARYYLHLRNFEGDVLKDEEGSEFPSLAAARKEAIFVMQDFVAAAIRQGDEPPFEAIVLADEHGTHLAAVPLIAALPTTIVGLFKHRRSFRRIGSKNTAGTPMGAEERLTTRSTPTTRCLG